MTTFYNKWCKYWVLHYLYIPIIIISGLVISCHLKLQRLMSQKIENPIRNKSEKWDLIFFTYINILKTLLGMSFTFTQNNHSKWTLLVSNINQASWDLSSIKSGIYRYWSKHFFYLAKVVSVQKGFVTKIGGNIEWSFKIHSCKINIGYQQRAIYPIYIRTWLELYAVVVFIRGIICNSIQWG